MSNARSFSTKDNKADKVSLNSEEAFKLFYEAHASKVRGLLFRLVGEASLSDLTQETFMKAWEYRERFRGESEASTWLYRIAYNCAVDFLRRSGKARENLQIDLATDTLEKNISDKEVANLALESLDIEHRAVAILFYIEDQPIKDIALTLDLPEGTVKSRLNHARNKMSEVLTKKGVKL